MIPLLFFLILCPSAFADEGNVPSNNVNFSVTQDYIISSDAMSKAGIVANQFDDWISPDSLPGDYGDELEQFIDDAFDAAPEYFQNTYSNLLPGALQSQFDMIQGLTNSSLHSQYGVSTTNGLGMTSSNIMPSTNVVSRWIGVFRSNPLNYTSTNLYHFGEYNYQENFYLNIPFPEPIGRFQYTAPINSPFLRIIRYGVEFLIRAISFLLVLSMCRKMVNIFIPKGESD